MLKFFTQEEQIEKCIILSTSKYRNILKNLFWSHGTDDLQNEKIDVCIGIGEELLDDPLIIEDIEKEVYDNFIFFESLMNLNFSIRFRLESNLTETNHCLCNNINVCEMIQIKI